MSRVDISDDIRSASDVDIVIIDGISAAWTFVLHLCPLTCTIIVVVERSSPTQRIGLLDAGVDLVLHGPVPDDEIIAQVRAIARRGSASVRTIVRPGRRKAKIVLDADRRHAVVLGRRITLTLHEGNLLAAFIARPGDVLASRELLTSLRGSRIGARSTVSAYIRRVRVKIEPDPSNPVFIRTVWGSGYVYRPDGEG